MDYPYDIFECLKDGTLLWRIGCADLVEAYEMLAELARSSENEFYAKDSSNQIVARVNEAGG